MPLSRNEIRHRAIQFAHNWARTRSEATEKQTFWNEFFGVFALGQGDSVKVFLLAKGVDCEKLNAKGFDITGQKRSFVDAGGKIMACGICLNLRRSGGRDLCPVSTLKDMYDIVKESDKVLTF